MEEPVMILASASPRRIELLTRIGLRTRVIEPNVDETPNRDESPEHLVSRLACAKVLSVAAQVPKGTDRLVLGADTVVVREGRILGKPSHREDAKEMLRTLSGGKHQVITGMAVCRTGDLSLEATSRSTLVRFRTLSDRWVEWYLDTGEPFGKAGAYAIQGAGALLVEAIEGSWSNVVGLPLEALPELLERLGVSLLDMAEVTDRVNRAGRTEEMDQPTIPE